MVEMDISTNQMPLAASLCFLCLAREIAGGKYIGMGPEGNTWNRKTRIRQREGRRLKVQVREMEELLQRKARLNANSQAPDFQTSQIELQEENKGQRSSETGSSLCVPRPQCADGSCLHFYTPPIWISPLCYPTACSFSYWDIKSHRSCMSTLWQVVYGNVRIWPIWQFQASP